MATIIDVFRSVFPDAPRQAGLGKLPRLPTDVFAFAAHLIERSGAYHHISPSVEFGPNGPYRRIVVTIEQQKRCAEIGTAWRNGPIEEGARLPTPPQSASELWGHLARFSDELVFLPLEDNASAPDWWLVCLELLMLADEACRDIGFEVDNPFFDFFMTEYMSQDLNSGQEFRRVQRAPFSLSLAAEDLICVQAKARTPSVGCTLRSLTHHLALLPPRGQVRARWVAPVIATDEMAPTEELGLLLIPIPFEIKDDSFRSAGEAVDGHWGWFEVNQDWLPSASTLGKRNALIDFVRGLIRSARATGARVDAVVLPELALDHANFRAMSRALANDAKIDFFIAGVSEDSFGRKGNFVATAPFFLLGRERDANITQWENLILLREKHHRWKLTGDQIESYNLTHLDSKRSWWERLDILSRSLDLLVYRGNSTLTTLICEDLARVDPCQAVVRAIGPNLLIALLMDGPQLGERWPGRYATVLAEDPGTSVLSLTSFGLMARQNAVGKFPPSSSIALWKDEKNGPRRLDLHRNSEALVLELKPVYKQERTLDGRTDDGSTLRWEYKRHVQVSIGNRSEASFV